LRLLHQVQWVEKHDEGKLEITIVVVIIGVCYNSRKVMSAHTTSAPPYTHVENNFISCGFSTNVTSDGG
jgi:hypothetical protein